MAAKPKAGARVVAQPVERSDIREIDREWKKKERKRERKEKGKKLFNFIAYYI